MLGTSADLPVLVVHVCGWGAHAPLAPKENELLADYALKAILQYSYTCILLPGGWCKGGQLRPTVGEEMRTYLIQRGVPSFNIYTPYQLGLSGLIPARTTLEEAQFVALMLEKLGMHSQGVQGMQLHAVCMKYHASRVERILKRVVASRVQLHRVPNVPAEYTFPMRVYDLGALGLDLLDSSGKSRIYRAELERRMLRGVNQTLKPVGEVVGQCFRGTNGSVKKLVNETI